MCYNCFIALETELMAKELKSSRQDHDLYGDTQDLFPWGFQRDLVPQASPKARKPAFRPHPKPSMGHKTIRLVVPSQKVNDDSWLAAMELSASSTTCVVGVDNLCPCKVQTGSSHFYFSFTFE